MAEEVVTPGAETEAAAETVADVDQSLVQWFYAELTGSYINIFLFCAILYLLYKIVRPSSEPDLPPPPPPLPPLKKQDMTPFQLKPYDGTGEEGRVCVAVNGKVYDVTKGKRFYGPGGPYSAFAGRDASRGLATFSVEPVSEDYDDLSDLKPHEMDQVKEWELQFSEKYTLVGKLLKPGEEATSYSDMEDDDEEASNNESADKKND